jgi:Snare region anchored in the vesicle membrane C-terminus
MQIRTYKDSLGNVANDLKRAKEKFSRSALMGGAQGGPGGANRPLDFEKSADARARMAATTDKLKTGTTQLNDANARLEETIGVGEGIMGELHRNRETMMRVRGNVGVVSGTLDEARRILRSE